MRPLRFATCLAPNVKPMYQFVADEVGRRLGLPTELVECDDYARFDTAEEDDVCFVCSLPYVLLSRRREAPVQPIAAPVLEGDRYEDRPIYFSDVIVRADSPFQSFEDLRGSSWAFNEPMSHSGYGITRYHLVRLGETNGFFTKVVETGFHERSIELVRAGKVDASAIDSQVLEVAVRDRPELREELRVVETFGPSTIQPVTVARRLPDPLREDIQSAILDLGDDQAGRESLQLGLVRRFAPVDDSSYDDIREMLAAVEEAEFTTLR
ncbi:MAG: phosphate/phosphite/phosphonate ABC transporter substrate-binding protein [Actinomycetota bacterium]